jgi:hypothetical protein
MKRIGLIFSLLPVLIIAGCIEKKSVAKDDLNLNECIQPLGGEGIFSDPDYFNWGVSIIRGEEGKYHMFYCRWPRKYGFYCWLTHSEVAHAVSDHPGGPYEFVNIALEINGPANPQIIACNPKIKHFNGRYYLYYASTHADTAFTPEDLVEIAETGYGHKYWMHLRNNQRTYVAVSESVDGPWKRSEKPVIEPGGPITTITNNPAITQGPEGKYYLIVKGDKPKETKFIRNQAIAIASSPAGPYTMHPEPVIGDLDTEDASLWYDETRGRFYVVFHAHTYIGMITSADGLNWGKAAHYEVIPKKILKTDDTYLEPDRMERPFVFIEDGKPQVLCLAIKKGNDAYAVLVPLIE